MVKQKGSKVFVILVNQYHDHDDDCIIVINEKKAFQTIAFPYNVSIVILKAIKTFLFFFVN